MYISSLVLYVVKFLRAKDRLKRARDHEKSGCPSINNNNIYRGNRGTMTFSVLKAREGPGDPLMILPAKGEKRGEGQIWARGKDRRERVGRDEVRGEIEASE